MDFKRASKERTLSFLRHKHYIWKVVKDDLISKNNLSSASRKPKMAPCGHNGGIWRFILKYSIIVHHNRLVLEQWTKRWMTVSPSKLQKEQSGALMFAK